MRQSRWSHKENINHLFRSIRHFIGFHRIFFSILVVAGLYAFAKPTPLSLLGGLPVVLAGAGIRIWSCGYLVKNKVLAQAGPYNLVRHPLYLGNFLIGLGFAFMAGLLALTIFFLAAWTVIYYATIKEEEKILVETFGEKYRDYARRVPRLIPRRLSPSDRETFHWSHLVDRKEYKAWLAIVGFLALLGLKTPYIAAWALVLISG